MGKVVFITGGARSGKSTFAEKLLDGVDDVLYIATAVPSDEEMVERIRQHVIRRNSRWHTVEAYSDLEKIICEKSAACKAVLIDCVTIMVTNLMFNNPHIDWDTISISDCAVIESNINQEIDGLLKGAERFNGTVIIVSNEIGMGIVPATPMSRHFRDIAGRVNQRIAASALEAYMLVSGIPLKIKGKE
jgi:adenosylcobinamide kinase / adenosylcobinamide-phosphate guanylyltransferase